MIVNTVKKSAFWLWSDAMSNREALSKFHIGDRGSSIIFRVVIMTCAKIQKGKKTELTKVLDTKL